MPHQNPTATQQSYWELGSQDAPLFARMVWEAGQAAGWVAGCVSLQAKLDLKLRLSLAKSQTSSLLGQSPLDFDFVCPMVDFHMNGD